MVVNVSGSLKNHNISKTINLVDFQPKSTLILSTFTESKILKKKYSNDLFRRSLNSVRKAKRKK